MSRRGEALAADVVAAVLERIGVAKSAGTVSLLYAVARPMAEGLVERDKTIRRMNKATRKRHREIREIQRTLAACAPGPAPRGMVPYVPSQWETKLAPRREPARVNGYDKEHDNGTQS